jgi:hypothetical protein
MDIQTYRLSKAVNRRLIEYLTAVGCSKDIFVSAPNLVACPIIGTERKLGFLMENHFKRIPIYARCGAFTTEAHRRAMKGLRQDVRLFTKCGF